MDVSRYKERLLAMERELSGRAEREMSLGREQVRDVAEDTGDASVADEAASTDFVNAEQDTAVLGQVKAALARIDAGTFGQCVVDGAPIDAARLDAVPWTPYCLKHQALADNTGAALP